MFYKVILNYIIKCILIKNEFLFKILVDVKFRIKFIISHVFIGGYSC